MSLIATAKPSNPAPAGTHAARCYQLIDLGTQTWDDFTTKRPKSGKKVRITWELLGDERMTDGRPFSISEEYTVSTHEKSNLRKALESWRGRPFTEEEAIHFDMTKLLGVYCLLNVMHNSKNGKTYANIAGIMPLPKAMPKPEPVNNAVMFDLDNRDMAVFDGFPDWLKDKIMASAEWGGATEKGDAFEDDIPWAEANSDEPVF